MRPIVVACALLLGGTALATSHDPAPSMKSQARQAAGQAKAEHSRWHPLDRVYRPVDQHRQNVGAPGRINATRDEQQVAETPSLQPAPLTGGTTW